MVNSILIGSYIKTFINNTISFQINDARQIPIIIPTAEQFATFENILTRALRIKKTTNDENELVVVQRELDELTLALYK